MTKNTAPTARCRYSSSGEATFTVSYKRAPVQAKAFIEDLKDAVPSRYRTYDPALKEWRVWGGFEDLAIALLVQHFPDAEVPRRARTHTTASGSSVGTDHFEVLHLLPTAPRELVEAAYRCLARLHHPDLGGHPSAMRSLNDAHDALSRRLSS